MKRFSTKLGICLGAALMACTSPASAATEIEFWHAMGSELGMRVEELAKTFNESQKDYVVKPVYKGSYEEIINGTIAAYRAKQHPAEQDAKKE